MSFEEYSLSELYDVRNHIDREKHPEKFKEIEQRIEELKASTEFIEKEFTIVSDRMARWMGVAQILIGTLIVFGLTNSLLFSEGSFQGNIFPTILASLFACSLLVFGGIFLYKNDQKGGWISAVGTLFFTLSFQISSIVYSMIPGFALIIGVSSINGLTTSLELGQFIFKAGATSEDEFRLGINILALIYLLIVASYKASFKYPDNYREVK